MKNLEISAIFKNIAKILEIKRDNPFRIRAYERAGQLIEGMTEDIIEFANKDKLIDLPGIGRDLAEKIKEIIMTGKLKFYEDLKRQIPKGFLEILDIPGVGPKTAKLLLDELKIKDVADLEKAARSGKLLGLANIKEKTVENILKGIELIKRGKERMNLATAMAVAQEFTSVLGKLPIVKKISVAGSLRRMKETVRDIDILVISTHPQKVMDVFTKIASVKDVQAKGPTKSSVLTAEDIQVDLRVEELKSFGAAILYFTGSKNFNIKLRQMAIRKKLKINEYGVFSVKGKKETYMAGRSEEEIFKLLGLDYIEPELREDTGEIELAARKALPHLVEISDIKGDLHAHSEWSDGRNSILEMANAAKGKGYAYIAITDHSQGLKIARGLNVSDLRKKKQEIEKINKELKGIRILYGTEVDIDSDGKLDYADKILAEFDIVVAAIHSGFKQSSEQLTKRITRACQNKYVHIIAHPTGRLWGARDSYPLDFDKVFDVARDTNTALEINAFPSRLDLNDQNCRRAKEKGVRLAVGTDSHSIEHLDSMHLGVSVARRGWLEKKDLLNTLSVGELLKTIKK